MTATKLFEDNSIIPGMKEFLSPDGDVRAEYRVGVWNIYISLVNL